MRKVHPKYFGLFTDRDDVAAQFEEGTGSKWQKDNPFVTAANFPKEGEIIFAAYGTGSYNGEALVVYRRDKKLYEVNGSHCSCYGLEGQWKPEETSKVALGMRKLTDYSYDRDTITRFYALFPSPKGGRS